MNMTKKRSEETKRRMREAWTPERRAKASRRSREMWDNPEYKEKMRKIIKESWTPERIAGVKESWTPKRRQEVSDRHTGYSHSEETKSKMSAAAKLRWEHGVYDDRAPCTREVYEFSDEWRAQHSARIREHWKQGTYDDIVFSRPRSYGPSSFEKAIHNACNKLGYPYEFEYRIPNTSRPFDLYVPQFNMLVELQGIYWHNYTIFPDQERRDKEKEQLALENGYLFGEIWESELSDFGPEVAFEQMIMYTLLS